MLIDCETCRGRGTGCPDCVIGVLLATCADSASVDAACSDAACSGAACSDADCSGDGVCADCAPEAAVDLDETEWRAMDVLAAAGLLPPVRLVPVTLPRRDTA